MSRKERLAQRYAELYAELSTMKATQADYWYIVGTLAVLRELQEEMK